MSVAVWQLRSGVFGYRATLVPSARRPKKAEEKKSNG